MQIFLVVLLIILLAPIVFNQLKIPHIIGMIVAGVVIGPYGFGVLDRDSSFAIFGQVGLLYLMFLAGLEIDMFHLRLNLRKGFVFGLLTLFIPLILGVITSVYVLHLDWTTSMLLGAMYASHTLLSYPIVARLGITKSPAVLISIVGTIVAVVGALLILAVTVNVYRDGEFDFFSFMRLISLMTLYCAVVLATYPRLTKWFFKRYSDRATQFVYVLMMVFMAAWLAQVVGMEPVLGAFFAGLVLNKFVPSQSALMGNIEFVGNALFIPYFLISVGMMINLRLVFDTRTLVVAAIMLTVALISKWVPALLAQRAFGLHNADRGVMFGLTTAHTAVALAIITLGHTLGMFDEQVLNATIVVILVTCAVAPIVTNAYAPKLKLIELRKEDEREGASVRATRGGRVNNTLIPVAEGRTAQSLVELAMLMRNDKGRHEMYALHVRSDNSSRARNESADALDMARKVAQEGGQQLTTIDRFDLNIATGVLNTINERDITEVILGLHRRHAFIDSFFGTKIETLLKSTNKMMIISRCFIPVSTAARIVVSVPPKAQYETGFARWVRGIARLARQIGCRIIFVCPNDIQPLIRGVLYAENYTVRVEFREAESWDDFILYTNRIRPDDLLFVIGARPASVSFTDTMVEMPAFLQKYFSQNNIIVIYPEQFGEQDTSFMSFSDPRATDIATTVSPLWLWLRSLGRGRKKRNDKDS